MNVRASWSDFSTNSDSSTPRSWIRTTSRGNTQAAATIAIARPLVIGPRARPGSRGDERRPSCVDVHALPQLQHAEAPQPVAVVGVPVDMLGEQPLQLGAAEEAAILAAEQQVCCERPQLLAEPAVERHPEARLAPACDL